MTRGPVEPVIRVEDLWRVHGDRAALRGLSFEVVRGTVTALVGRNGAGKTTALRILLGLDAASRGRGVVLGRDCRDLGPAERARMGHVAEGHPLPGWMAATECERFDAATHPRWNRALFAAVLQHFDIDPTRRVHDLSRGQRAGLSLALALAPEPELLVLDDPCLGLDPIARHALLESLVHVVERGDRTVLMSSQVIGDLERLADRLVILERGRLRAACAVDTFRSRVRRFACPPEIAREAAALPGFLRLERRDDECLVTVVLDDGAPPPEQAREEVPMTLEEALVAYLGDRGERPSLTDHVRSAA